MKTVKLYLKVGQKCPRCNSLGCFHEVVKGKAVAYCESCDPYHKNPILFKKAKA